MATSCGFVPADDPQLSVCAVIQHPTAGAYTGGAVAAPVFADFAEFAVAHLHISPSDLELSPEDLGVGTVAVVDAEEGHFYTAMGEPPPGMVRAEPTRGRDEEGGAAVAGAPPDAESGAPLTDAGATTLSG
jgi:hypothetical protein